MEVSMTLLINLKVDKKEFLLISKALRGTLKDNEKLEAQALQEKMVLQKHAILEDMTDQSAKLLKNIEDSKDRK